MKKTLHQITLAFLGVALVPASALAQVSDQDYSKALWMTTRFYGAQRATDVNKTEPQHNWILQDYKPSGVPESKRGIAFAGDADGSYDLSGGWFDCGDHVFFGQTGFFAVYMLLKGYEEFKAGHDDFYGENYTGYRTTGDYSWEGAKGIPNNIPDVLDEAKHATDFLIKCARNSTTFYYEKGDGQADHRQRVTAVKMQTNSVADGGEPREMWKNPNGASMASMCGASLALMSRLYRPFDAAYADLCLVHAKYAYDYAKSKTGSVGAASGTFYSGNDNYKNGLATMYSELYQATGQNTYRTEALAFTTDHKNDGDVHPNDGYTFDYSNTGEIALYALAEIGHPTAAADFNTRIQNKFIDATNYNAQGVYKNGGGWGKLRYVGNAGMLVALHAKMNGTSLNNKVYDNVNYVLGDNTGNQSYIVGFEPEGISNVVSPTQTHHRNVYHYEGNNNNFVASIPLRNQQFGALVGGALDGSYDNTWTTYVDTEVCVDYNVGIVGALAAINEEKNPVDTNKFFTACSTPDLGEDVSLCGVGSIELSSGITPDGIKKFEWFKDGISQANATTNGANYTITQPGTWKVVVDSLGECSRSSAVQVSGVLGTVDLGADVDLCRPTMATLDAGISGTGVTYVWQKNGNTLSETDRTLEVSAAGTYGVTVSASGCASISDEVVVVSSLPETLGDRFCLPHKPVATLEVVGGMGDYRWYTAASGGNLVGEGDVVDLNPTSTTTYYLEDQSAFSGVIGPGASTGESKGWGMREYADDFYVEFTANSDFKINAISIPYGTFYNSNPSVVAIDIYTAAGVKKGTFTSETRAISPGLAGLVEFTFTDFEVLSSWGPNLRMAMNAGGTTVSGQLLWHKDGTYNFPYSTTSGAVSITGAKTSDQSGNNYAFFFNWEIEAGKDCERVPVVAELACLVGTEDVKSVAVAHVFPNPSTETATLKSRTNQVSQVSVINAKGQLVDQFELDGSTLFGAQLSSGVYFIQVTNGTDAQVIKFVKE